MFLSYMRRVNFMRFAIDDLYNDPINTSNTKTSHQQQWQQQQENFLANWKSGEGHGQIEG